VEAVRSGKGGDSGAPSLLKWARRREQLEGGLHAAAQQKGVEGLRIMFCLIMCLVCDYCVKDGVYPTI
jgi:hypothetical protein